MAAYSIQLTRQARKFPKTRESCSLRGVGKQRTKQDKRVRRWLPELDRLCHSPDWLCSFLACLSFPFSRHSNTLTFSISLLHKRTRIMSLSTHSGLRSPPPRSSGASSPRPKFDSDLLKAYMKKLLSSTLQNSTWPEPKERDKLKQWMKELGERVKERMLEIQPRGLWVAFSFWLV